MTTTDRDGSYKASGERPDAPREAGYEPNAFGPKDGSMTIGDGVDGRPYVSDPIKERIAMPGPSYNPGPEHLDAIRREVHAELAETQAAIEREAKYAVGAGMIAAERRRQVEKEGWTPEHDAGHRAGELTAAALCYLSAALCNLNPDDPRAAPAVYEPPVAPYWPWEPEAYKVTLGDPMRSLVKAGALIAAEIDRLQADA